MTFAGLTIQQGWSPKPAADWASFIDPNLSFENQSYSKSTEPLSIAQFNTAFLDGLVPQHHMSVLDYVESKALNIIQISRDEAVAQGLLFSHHRQVGGLCFLPPLLQ